MNLQSQTQKQQHKALAHHVAMMNIFHMDNMGIEQLIRDEVNDNPLIDHAEEINDKNENDSAGEAKDFENPVEYDDNGDDYKMEYGHYLSQQNFPEKQIEETIDFRDELKKQFRIIHLQESDYPRADFIIDSLNDKGFLEQDEESIAEEISFKEKNWLQPEDLRNIVTSIQSLEPQGCGCRDIREYLLFQLKKMNVKRPDVYKAICLLEQNYNDLKKTDFKKISADLNIEQDEIKILLELLAGLKKSPCSERSAAWTKTNIIIPDFLITLDDDDTINIQLNREYSDKLSVNQSGIENFIPSKSKERGKQAVRFLKNKLASAKWFINAIRERETNMLKIMKAIADFQKEYFFSMDEMLLKPMGLKDIAQKVSLDISTVSRITSNKYAETPHGNIKLKDLFTKSIATDDGKNISNKVVHETIRDLINEENKKQPYTDKQLVAMLAEKGIQLARRTVTKYREELNIPVAYKRIV